MSIRSMEIICPPCQKCERLKTLIKQSIASIEIQNKIKITYDFTHTVNLKNINQYSVNAAQAPILLINGNVEFAGAGGLDGTVLKNRLMSIHRQ